MLTLRMPRISPGRRPAASAAAPIRHRTAGRPQPYRDRAAGLGFHVEVADAVVAPVLGVAGVCPGAVDDLNGFCEAIEDSGVSQLRKGCWQIRKMFIPMIMTAQLQAKMVATRRLGGVHPGRSSAASCSQRPFASSTRARTLLSRRQHSPLRARRPRPCNQLRGQAVVSARRGVQGCPARASRMACMGGTALSLMVIR